MTVFGYARVATSDQNLDLQTKALSEAGSEVLVCERASGQSFDRPELERLLREPTEDDTLWNTIESSASLGRRDWSWTKHVDVEFLLWPLSISLLTEVTTLKRTKLRTF